MADDFDVTFGGGRNNLNVEFENPQKNLTLKNTAPTKRNVTELNDVVEPDDAKEDGSILVYDKDQEKYNLTKGNVIKNANGIIRIAGSLIPSQNNVYDLGSENSRFRSVYLAGQTIFVGNLTLSDSGEGRVTLGDVNTNAVLGTISTQTLNTKNIQLSNTYVDANGNFEVYSSNVIFYNHPIQYSNVTNETLNSGNTYVATVGFVKNFTGGGRLTLPLAANTVLINASELTITANTSFVGDIHMTGDIYSNTNSVIANSFISLSAPTQNNQLTTKLYVDNLVANVDFIANGISMGIGADITDGAVTSITANNTIYQAIDKINEAMLNVQNSTYVRSVSFTSDITSAGAGTEVTLSLVVLGSPNQYTINWGDGTVDTTSDATPSHTYVSNANSPYDVSVTARNTSGTGEGSNASFSRADYITIFLADPVPSFTINDAASGGSVITEANTGQVIYLENTTTNIPNTDITATFFANWGDGSNNAIASKVADGGPQGNRLSHTYTTASGSGKFPITITANTFSSGNPSVFPLSNTVFYKVFDLAIAAPNGINTKTISWATGSVGASAKLAAGFTDNSPGKGAGDTISSDFPRFTTGTVTTSAMSTYFHTTTSVGQRVNDVTTGTPITDESGVDYYDYDATGASVSPANRIYAEGLYETGTKARFSYNVTSGSVGVNKAELFSDGNSNELYYVYDTMTSAPTVDVSGVTVNEVSASYNYVSGIPYYDNGDTITISGITVNNLTGQTYLNSSTPFTVGGTNVEGVTGTGVADQTYNYTTALAVGDQVGGNPKANLSPDLESLSVAVSSGDRAVKLTVEAVNVNGNDTATINSPIIQVSNGADVINEAAIVVSDSLGAGFDTDGVRITGFTGETPSFSSSTDYYTGSNWSGAETIAGTDEAVVRYGSLTHFDTDLSSGYLPVGPDLQTGRSGTQYFRFVFKRTSVSNFRVRLSGKVSGFYIAAPGTAIDSASTLNGWLDASLQYAGSGVPGANTGSGGNGSNGCAFTGGDRILDGTTYSNETFDLTFGTVSSSASFNNQVLITVALNSDDSLTALSIEAAT